LIRKEHVRCRYGVFKVRASSQSSTPNEKAAHRGRGTEPVSAMTQSFKAQQRAAGPREDRHVNEVDVVLGELDHRTTPSTSSSHQRVQQPPE